MTMTFDVIPERMTLDELLAYCRRMDPNGNWGRQEGESDLHWQDDLIAIVYDWQTDGQAEYEVRDQYGEQVLETFANWHAAQEYARQVHGTVFMLWHGDEMQM
jgi:hypothetical protein